MVNFVPDTIKTLREDVYSREMKYVAFATALGARVSQAKLFAHGDKKQRFYRIHQTFVHY